MFSFSKGLVLVYFLNYMEKEIILSIYNKCSIFESDYNLFLSYYSLILSIFIWVRKIKISMQYIW